MPVDESQKLFTVEYRDELEVWLRRRFRYLCITYLALGAIDLLVTALAWNSLLPSVLAIELAGKSLRAGVVAWFLLGRDWSAASREQILAAATRMIVVLGVLSVLSIFSIRQIDPAAAPTLILPLFFWHFSACLFLPWTPRESLRPFVPLLVVWAVLVLVFSPGPDIVVRVLKLIFGPAVLLPGLGIAAWRMRQHSQSFRRRMVGQHFLSLRREFSRAREIHENMFPAPHDDGFVQFEYTYQPARDLGGDYIHLHVGAEGLVHLTLLDVTGHGLAAALTVNRLYGELERIRAESPRADPRDVITLLNRYINYTLARHNIYATALSLQLDPYLGELRWANAGHPPAYLRGVNGVITEVDSTAMVLGAMTPEQFEVEARRVELSPGDTIVLYTDGAFEARDRTGRQLGLARLRELMSVNPPPRHWPRFISSVVSKHTTGRHDDDVLIAAITFLSTRQLKSSSAPAAAMASESS